MTGTAALLDSLAIRSVADSSTATISTAIPPTWRLPQPARRGEVLNTAERQADEPGHRLAARKATATCCIWAALPALWAAWKLPPVLPRASGSPPSSSLPRCLSSCVLGVLLTLTGGLTTLPLPALVLYQAAWCVLAMIFPLFQRYLNSRYCCREGLRLCTVPKRKQIVDL